MSAPTLTKQQKRAMFSFLWSAGPRGYDDETSDLTVWDWGVRPWPTMANLARKGLVESDAWNGLEEGWTYRLTPAGEEYMRAVVAERAGVSE